MYNLLKSEEPFWSVLARLSAGPLSIGYSREVLGSLTSDISVYDLIVMVINSKRSYSANRQITESVIISEGFAVMERKEQIIMKNNHQIDKRQQLEIKNVILNYQLLGVKIWLIDPLLR